MLGRWVLIDEKPLVRQKMRSVCLGDVNETPLGGRLQAPCFQPVTCSLRWRSCHKIRRPNSACPFWSPTFMQNISYAPVHRLRLIGNCLAQRSLWDNIADYHAKRAVDRFSTNIAYHHGLVNAETHGIDGIRSRATTEARPKRDYRRLEGGLGNEKHRRSAKEI